MLLPARSRASASSSSRASGPGPFAAMMLADMGADVLRVDRADRVAAAIRGHPLADL